MCAYPKSMIADVLVPAQTLKAVKLFKVLEYYLPTTYSILYSLSSTLIVTLEVPLCPGENAIV